MVLSLFFVRYRIEYPFNGKIITKRESTNWLRGIRILYESALVEGGYGQNNPKSDTRSRPLPAFFGNDDEVREWKQFLPMYLKKCGILGETINFLVFSQ